MQLDFGPLVIECELPPTIKTPIGIAYWNLNGDNAYVTQCPVRFARPGTQFDIVVAEGFEFDGASVPQEFWGVDGYAPIGKHVWAALAHDWLCAHPELMEREIADAVFSTLLKQTGVPTRRARIMAAAVKLYRIVHEWLSAES